MNSAAGIATAVLLLLQLLAVAGSERVVKARQAEADADSPAITLLLQLTDIHLSRFHHSDPLTGTSRAEDLEVFGHRLLRAWRPDAILITGDLTDAKTPGGRGEQYRAEWREYKRVWQKLVDAAGLPASLLLDVRGNHDSFDIGARGGTNDPYMAFSGRAARAVHGNAAEFAFPRINVDAIHPRQAASRGRNSSSAASKGLASLPFGTPKNSGCPTAVMVSVDATPNPGLRNPTNFLGVVGPDMLIELQQRLAGVHATARATNCQPPAILAYGHHTLSTLAYGSAPVMGLAALRVRGGCGRDSGAACDLRPGEVFDQDRDAQLPASARVEDVLAAWDASAYLCGHLHDTFGLRVHRLYPKPPQAPGRPASGHMAELLLPDWKYSRWFRLVTVDPQAGLSFADMQFIRDLNDQGDAEEPMQIVGVDRARSVSAHVVLITAPPDARYSHLPADPAAAGSAARVGTTLRALLLPALDDAGPAGLRVSVSWSCAVSLTLRQARGTHSLLPTAVPWVYEADLEDAPGIDSCVSDLKIQVVVATSDGRVSRSEVRPVRAPRQCSGNVDDRHCVTPAPLDLRLSELIILRVRWAAFGAFGFHLQWALLVAGLLVTPRLLGQPILAIHSAMYRLCWGMLPTPPWNPTSAGGGLQREASVIGGGMPSPALGRHASVQARDSMSIGGGRDSSLASQSSAAAAIVAALTNGGAAVVANGGGVTGAGAPAHGSHSRNHSFTSLPVLPATVPLMQPLPSAGGAAGGCLRRCVARPVAWTVLAVLWPLRDVARLAMNHPELWWALLVFAVNLQIGPWFAGFFATTIDGVGVMTAHGVLLPGPPGHGYVNHRLHDACIITDVHMVTAVLPTYVWLASVVAFWSDLAAGGKLAAGRLLSWPHVIALFVIVPLHVRLVLKIATLYGWPAMLLAPATGWLMPLALLWLRHARANVGKTRRD